MNNYKLKSVTDKYNQLLIKIISYFQNSNNSIHKARNEIKVINYNNEEVIVKSFKVPHIINKIVYSFFRDSKAKKSYDYSIKIIDFVPKPIGYVEFQRFGLIHDSYFVSKNFNYDFTIREPLLDENFENREEVFRAFARFTFELHEQNIFHKDYSPGNILIKKEEDTYIFKIVDINRMGFFELSQKDRAKNFSKLWASDEVLKIIAKEYSKHYSVDKKFQEQILYYNQKNKNIKNFKKRLKGKKVDD